MNLLGLQTKRMAATEKMFKNSVVKVFFFKKTFHSALLQLLVFCYFSYASIELIRGKVAQSLPP